MKKILSLHYLGNTQYYTKLISQGAVIDIHENYHKQSYRNRCDILTANGVEALSVNVVKSDNWAKSSLKECRIDYTKRWQQDHWRAMCAAYRGSPFFEFYADDFEPFYHKRFDFLLDYNLGLLELTLKLLRADVAIALSDKYIDNALIAENNWSDLRDSISPKPRLNAPDPYFSPSPYWQVFNDRHGFTPNLSIVDLLFCEGTNALAVLNGSILG